MQLLALSLAVVLEVAGICVVLAFVGFLAYGIFDDRFLDEANVLRWIGVTLWALLSLTAGCGLHLLVHVLRLLERIEGSLSRDDSGER